MHSQIIICYGCCCCHFRTARVKICSLQACTKSSGWPSARVLNRSAGCLTSACVLDRSPRYTRHRPRFKRHIFLLVQYILSTVLYLRSASRQQLEAGCSRQGNRASQRVDDPIVAASGDCHMHNLSSSKTMHSRRNPCCIAVPAAAAYVRGRAFMLLLAALALASTPALGYVVQNDQCRAVMYNGSSAMSESACNTCFAALGSCCPTSATKCGSNSDG